MDRSNSILDNNFEILRDNLIGSTQEYDNENRFGSDDLRPIEEIPHPYQQIFADYSGFNVIQSKVIDDVLYTDDSLVLSAPTGSGKTVVFELAIVRLLISLEQAQFSEPFKIVYISPMKALCEERVVDWHTKFADLGITAISVTGDSENFEIQSLINHNLIITTPEKWDCLTRKWRENIKLVKTVKLFMIDEVHLLNEESRGSSLETIVCRMKTIEESVNSQEQDYSNHKIRFIAVSAAIPNIEDIAEWIGKSSNAKCYKFSDEYRPVKLKKIVLGYPCHPTTSDFKFDLSLNYKLHTLIMEYSHGKPTLIFCGTRKIVEMTAKHLLQHLTINLKPEQKERLFEASGNISDTNVKKTLLYGVGYHHAGMLPQTRRVIENLFRNSDLPILVTTSTLAMGVNLPAHLVIIKSTKCYSDGGFRDYTETALSQMIGRAGRPQYDTEATALILTTLKDKEKFEKMIGELRPVESHLHKHLIEHLNAEVVLQTITDLGVAMRWLSSTFLYIRARKNPRFYGLTSSDPRAIDRRLLEMCQIELNKLIKAGMLTIDEDVLLKATPVGSAMAKYYLAFETMKLFTEISGGEILQQILALISKCHEFSEMYLRVNDKKCLNLLNKCRSRETIRFPLNGKIKTLAMKINCIIQAVLGCLDICDHSISTEALKIMRNGERIVKCLIEYLESKDKCYRALLNTIILAKCFTVKLWENSPHVCKQLPGIGKVMSSQLVNAGKTSFQMIAESDPREIELIINKRPPAGCKILEQIHHLPKYRLSLESYNQNNIKIIVCLQNAEDLAKSCTINRNSLMYLIVGDSSNNILLYGKYSHSFFIENVEVVKIIEFQDNLEDIEANLISEDWVGIDCTTKFEVTPKSQTKEEGKLQTKGAKKNKNDLTYMKTFMEMYLQCKRTKEAQALKNATENEDVADDTNNERKMEIKEESNTDEGRNGKIIIRQNITIFDKNNNKRKNNYEKEMSMRRNDDMKETVVTVVPCTLSLSSPDVLEEKENTSENFRFTPRKQLSTTRDLQTGLCKSPESTKLSTPTNGRSNTKITWRSPLTYSPAVKFSPKINYASLDTSPAENNRLSSCGSSNTQKQEIASKTFNRSNFCSKTPRKTNLSQSQVMFPLSDKAYADASLDESSKRRNEILEKVGDVVSSTFLESFGLISPVKKQNVQSPIQTPNEYYHQLLSQSQEEDNAYEEKEVSSNKKLDQRLTQGLTPTRGGFYTAGQNERRLQTSFDRNQNMKKDRGAVLNTSVNPFLNQSLSKSKEFCGESRYFTQRNASAEKFHPKIKSTRELTPKKVNLKKLTSPKTQFVTSHHLVKSPRQEMSLRNSDFLNRTQIDTFDDTFQNRYKNVPFVEEASGQNIQPTLKYIEGRNESRSKSNFPFYNQDFEKVPNQHLGINRSSSNNLVARQRFQETPKQVEEEIIDRSVDDPFNDSFESMFINYQIPPQILQSDQNNKSFTKRSSSFVDLNEPKSFSEELFDEDIMDYQALNLSQNNCNPSINKRNSFDRAKNESQNEGFPYLRQTGPDTANFDQFQYTSNERMHQNQRFSLPKPDLVFRRNNSGYAYPRHQNSSIESERNQIYPNNLNFRNNDMFERSYFDSKRQNLDYYDGSDQKMYVPSARYQNNDFENFDSYSYLRGVMEKESNPLLRDINSNHSSRNFERFGDERRFYPQRSYQPPELSSQWDYFNNADLERKRSYLRDHDFFAQAPYAETVTSSYSNYPKPQYLQTEKENCYPRYHPYDINPTDKNYVMQRFLNTMKNPQKRSSFYN